MTSLVRPAAVAGAFYESETERLRAQVERLLDGAAKIRTTARLFLVPHAGLVYSGPVAATAWAAIARLRPTPQRVLLLGPSHHVAFRGIATSPATAFATPLGTISLAPLPQSVKALPQIVEASRAHEREHALEVQLPFLQVVLPGAAITPLIVGAAEPSQVAEVLDALDEPATLTVISSDLSHLHAFDAAKAHDARTLARIEQLDASLDGEDACGCRPLNGAILFARRHELTVRVLDARNSAETAGGPDRVVGYAAVAFERRGPA